MLDVISYLNNPQLVANFQKIFGIESHFDSKSTSHARSEVTNGHLSSTTTLTAEEATSNGHVKRVTRSSANNQTNVKSDTSNGNGAVKSAAVEKKNSPVRTKKESSPPIVKNSVDSVAATTAAAVATPTEGGASKHRRQLSLVNKTDHNGIIANTIIHSKFWYYMFHLGAAMGNEIFYCLFFPFWFWNVDGAIARKVGFLWGIFMYIGQATKDLMCMPRPCSPPVVKLEERYVAEYGFPSTHAMVSAGLPISLVVLSHMRYNINLPISIGCATVFCCWVCCSRLYLGMHSLLDVLAGVFYSIFLLVCVMPILEPVDTFMIENPMSPFIALVSGWALCYYYPSLKKWSTARGDTTIIIGTVVGFSVGSFLNNAFGFLHRPDEPPLYEIIFPNYVGYVFGVVRTFLGLLSIYVTRQLLKSSLLRFLCFLNDMDYRDPTSKKEQKIELPYNYITYFFIGLNMSFLSPLMFRILNIERDYSFTEL